MKIGEMRCDPFISQKEMPAWEKFCVEYAKQKEVKLISVNNRCCRIQRKDGSQKEIYHEDVFHRI